MILSNNNNNNNNFNLNNSQLLNLYKWINLLSSNHKTCFNSKINFNNNKIYQCKQFNNQANLKWICFLYITIKDPNNIISSPNFNNNLWWPKVNSQFKCLNKWWWISLLEWFKALWLLSYHSNSNNKFIKACNPNFNRIINSSSSFLNKFSSQTLSLKCQSQHRFLKIVINIISSRSSSSNKRQHHLIYYEKNFFFFLSREVKIK